MTTRWEPETEELSEPFGKADWDALSVEERASKAKESGLEGKLGGKSWEDLTPRERATIIDPEKRPVKLDHQVKAHIALEDSDKENWGMVKYLEPGNYALEAGEGELVGNWSRSPKDGLIHVFLEDPLTALVDKAIQQFAEYATRRKAEAAAPKTRKARVPKAAPEPSEALVKIDRLRKMLGR